MIKFEYKFKVEFYDVDSMDVVWHGNYVKFLEASRCAFLSDLGYDYKAMKQDGFAFPIIKMDLKYIAPAFFGDELRCEVYLEDYSTTLKISYKIFKGTNLICKATTTQACVEIKGLKTMFELPVNFHKALKERYDV